MSLSWTESNISYELAGLADSKSVSKPKINQFYFMTTYFNHKILRF